MDESFIRKIDKGLTEEELLDMIDFSRLPAHIAIIMDGNRRWARERNMPGFMGHRKGVEAFRKVLTACVEIGVKYLTVYAFSMENWKRSEKEIEVLMKLFESYCHSEKQLMKDEGVQFRVIGKTDELRPSVIKAFREVSEYTRDGDKTILNLCVNYGSRYEILNAIRLMMEDFGKGIIDSEKIDEELFSGYLYTAGVPDPDLLIRTSGELRISNFLLWQCAYAELWFTDIYWPDFDKKALLTAIIDYQKRDRRFGGGKASVLP